MHGSRLGASAVVSAVTIWAFTNTLIKLSPLPALTFAVHRVWLGAAVLLVALYATGRRLTWPVIRTSAPGGLLLGLEIAFFFSAVKRTSIADVAMISAMQPALVLLVAGRLFGERVTRREIALASLALAGIGLVIVSSSGTPAWSLGGDVLAACSLVCWTVYFLVSKRARATVSTFPYMTVVFAVSAVVITPIVALSGQPLGRLDARDLGYLALFVLGASSGHLLVAWAHSTVDVSVSSLLMLAQPVIAPIAALLILGEPIGPLAIAGGLIVIASLAAIVRRATAADERLEPELPQV